MSETNPFVIDETTEEGGGSKYIQIVEEKDFIQTDVLVTKFQLSEDAKYIEVEVTNSKGQAASRRWYLPKEESEYPEKKKYLNAVKVFMGNMANISRKYMGESYKVTGNTAAEIANKVISDITPKLDKVKVAVLLELNEVDKGIFTNIGSFAPFSVDGSDLAVDGKQRLLLQKKLISLSAKPDSDLPPTGETKKTPF